MKDTLSEITIFLEDLSGYDSIESNCDIFQDIKLTGDDFHEMIEKFAQQFSVDLNGYLWYFHCDEEGLGFCGTFFAPPYLRVKRIPVTPFMLAEFANKGKWEINYPEHKIPKFRYDILINQILLVLTLAVILCGIIFK